MTARIFSKQALTGSFYPAFALLIGLAWALLAIWQNSPYAELLGHEALEDRQISFGGHLAAFLLSWLLMTVAMMLPASLPLLGHFIQSGQGRVQDFRRAGSLLLGYLLPWVLFGLFIYLGDSRLHELSEPGGPLAALSDWIAPAILFAAGLYQLTPLKRSFSDRCRPDSVEEYGSMKLAGMDPLAQGLQLGLLCAGSCGSLMLVMFALGHHRLEWMLALSAVLAAERLAPWGKRLAWLVGAGLLVGSVLWVIL